MTLRNVLTEPPIFGVGHIGSAARRGDQYIMVQQQGRRKFATLGDGLAKHQPPFGVETMETKLDC